MDTTSGLISFILSIKLFIRFQLPVFLHCGGLLPCRKKKVDKERNRQALSILHPQGVCSIYRREHPLFFEK